MSSEDPNSWRTVAFRQSVVTKIEEAVQKSGMPMGKNGTEMEQHVFSKAKTKEEYLGFVARLILHVREINTKKGPGMAAGANNAGNIQQGMPDPINALQTLARQGTGNDRGMGIPGPGSNPQNIIPQQAPGTGNTATNLLQSLNQRPGQNMNMPGMQNKMPGMGMIPGQPGGPQIGVNQMGHMGGMQTNSMMAQMNQMNQSNMQQQMAAQVGPGQQQMNTGQMASAQMGTGQIQQNMQNQMQGQMQGPMGGHSLGVQISGMQSGMPTQQQQPQQQQSQHMNAMNTAQMGGNQIPPQQLTHLQRKPIEMMNTGFPGPRNVTPNQFLRQSPSPSAPSPGGLGTSAASGGPSSNQMVPSPSLVPSPSPQHAMLPGPPRSAGMAQSPSSSLNTPGGSLGQTQSPSQEEKAYQEKIRKLSKYIEPLRKRIMRGSLIEGNDAKLSKMKKLLEILSNPSERVPLETLLKCEVVLDKMDFNRSDASVGSIPTAPLKEDDMFSPLLEAVRQVLKTPCANHTLRRTFGPFREAFGHELFMNLPPPLKKQKIEENNYEIPDVLQGEIARMDQRFKVSLDPAQQTGSKCILLLCSLDDKHLPSVPTVQVIVPDDYPISSPRIILGAYEYETPFLSRVHRALENRLQKLPILYTISQLLDTWEMSVRQACAPEVQRSKSPMPTIPPTTEEAAALSSIARL